MIRALFVVLCLVGSLALHGQVVRTIDGRRYQEHVVEAGQTLYGISRHFAVPLDELLRQNPATAQGLSVGQVVLIPLEGINRREQRNAPTMRDGDLVHTVARKETLFGVAQRYKVDINDLLERNPEATGGLKEGMTLVIPMARVKDVAAAQLTPAAEGDATMHLVEPGETLYALSKRYGVTGDAIQAANGGLPEGLKAGHYVRIPLPTTEPVVEEPRPAAGTRYHIALLLPFALDKDDSLHQADPTAKGFHDMTNIALQFQAGARMALDSLATLGLNAEVHLYDVGTDAATWGPVVRRSEMRDMDLFIGPFHRGAIDQLTALAKGTHVVCPVAQTNKVILGQPHVSKVIAGRSEQVEHLARFIASRFARENILLVRGDLPAERDLQDQMARLLQQSLGTRNDRLRDSLVVVRPGKRDLGDLAGKLDANRDNILVVPSEDVEYVSSLVTKLLPLLTKYRIKVMGMPSWTAMEVIEPADLNKLNTHVPASTFIDREDPAVIQFSRVFMERYRTDPDPYAFLGFDVTFFYVTALMQEGRGFADHFDRVSTRPLHMGFRMKSMGLENGMTNAASVILEYRDMALKRIP